MRIRFKKHPTKIWPFYYLAVDGEHALGFVFSKKEYEWRNSKTGDVTFKTRKLAAEALIK